MTCAGQFSATLPRSVSLLALVLSVAWSAPSRAQAQDSELSAQAIVDRALEHNTLGVDSAISQMTLVLWSKRGSKRERSIELRSLQIDGRRHALLRFHAPADVAGTGLLVIEEPGDDDQQYLYLPALGKVKRITGSQRNQRFMGTDLTYADLESQNLKRGNLRRLPDEKSGGNDSYVIEAVPKDLGQSQYGKTVTWVHKTSFVPLKVEFFDKKLQLLKTLKVRKLERRSGVWVVMASVIENVQSKTRTEMTVDNLQLKAPLDVAMFTQRSLQSE